MLFIYVKYFFEALKYIFKNHLYKESSKYSENHTYKYVFFLGNKKELNILVIFKCTSVTNNATEYKISAIYLYRPQSKYSRQPKCNDSILTKLPTSLKQFNNKISCKCTLEKFVKLTIQRAFFILLINLSAILYRYTTSLNGINQIKYGRFANTCNIVERWIMLLSEILPKHRKKTFKYLSQRFFCNILQDNCKVISPQRHLTGKLCYETIVISDKIITGYFNDYIFYSNANFGILNCSRNESDVDTNKPRIVVETVQMHEILKVLQHNGKYCTDISE